MYRLPPRGSLPSPPRSQTFRSATNIPHPRPAGDADTAYRTRLIRKNKMEENRIARISVTWRGRQLDLDADPSCTVKEFGQLLQDLTSVKPDTLKLIVPQSTNKGSKLIAPYSDSHSGLTLNEAAICEGKPIRMMGVFEDEIEEVSDNGKRPDLRIIGFDEEEQRLKQRSSGRPQISLKLPQGQYIFCDFRTLHLPGIELNPPPSEALKRMHMLACDPGIVAIMNKNMGEEISLRLRTDDLKGFRKYESIKKTLLHELAHMVHSEHDANFFALNKQLNEEAASLDWTKSRVGHRLGGESSSLASAPALAGAAAYSRLLNAPTVSNFENMKVEPDPDDHDAMHVDVTIGTTGSLGSGSHADKRSVGYSEAPDVSSNVHILNKELMPGGHQYREPDPDDGSSEFENKMEVECGPQKNITVSNSEPDPDDSSSAILNQDLGIDSKRSGETHPNDTACDSVMESGNEMEVMTAEQSRTLNASQCS
ncbi:hypothetical protein PR202_gb02766 [Eleusine coracana subsp. coracana]|uniref:WLM domain-containing protein n=1 Tax=Eleusine coracana subsp. coracana TaxID=191504 RepID=A0AAV5DXW1_ELECO|nr:hypothetical protein PR202_gb02766 [Eleusine coracana subsp. coracana]